MNSKLLSPKMQERNCLENLRVEERKTLQGS